MINSRFPIRMIWTVVVFSVLLIGMHALIYMLSPFQARFPLEPVWGALLVFLLISGFTAILTVHRGINPLVQSNESDFLFQLIQSGVLRKLAILTLIGLALHIYAKHYLTYLRPVSCLFEIRFAWLEVNHDLLPIYVRIASILGHLLMSFAYVGTLLASWALVSPPPNVNTRRLFLYLMLFIISGTVYAGFIGSRNIMLAFVILNFFGVMVALCSQKFAKAAILRVLPVLLLPAIIGLGFSAAVFTNRMYCGNNNVEKSKVYAAKAYLKGFGDEFAIDLGQSQSQSQSQSLDQPAVDQVNSFLSKICNSCAPTFLYVNHGIINFSQVMATPDRGNHVLFNFLSVLKNLVSSDATDDAPPNKRVYGPGGLPLAGAAYHDYGWFGLISVAVFFGLMFGIGALLLRYEGYLFGIGMMLVTSCFYTLAVSNIFVGPQLISFPFVVFSMGVVLVLFPLLSWRTRLSCATSN